MYYVSTRGGEVRADFRSVVLSGLAEDGGLYVPASLPVFTEEQITSWSWLPFDELVDPRSLHRRRDEAPQLPSEWRGESRYATERRDSAESPRDGAF